MTRTNGRPVLRLLLLIVVTVALTMQAACSSADTKTFTLNVISADGQTRTETIKTEKTKLGDALVDEEIIPFSEDGFVTAVYGDDLSSLSNDKQMAYWAFYIGDNYADTGIFDTDITDGAEYTLKVDIYVYPES